MQTEEIIVHERRDKLISGIMVCCMLIAIYWCFPIAFLSGKYHCSDKSYYCTDNKPIDFNNSVQCCEIKNEKIVCTKAKENSLKSILIFLMIITSILPTPFIFLLQLSRLGIFFMLANGIGSFCAYIYIITTQC